MRSAILAVLLLSGCATTTSTIDTTATQIKGPIVDLAQTCAFIVELEQLVTQRDGVRNRCPIREVTQPINKIQHTIQRIAKYL